MSWKKYFGFNTKVFDDLFGYGLGDINNCPDGTEIRNEYGYPEITGYLKNQPPQNTWTTVTTTSVAREKPYYHPASYAKRWRR